MGLLMGKDVVKFMDIVHVMKVGKDTSACSVSKKTAIDLLISFIPHVQFKLNSLLTSVSYSLRTKSIALHNTVDQFYTEYQD